MVMSDFFFASFSLTISGVLDRKKVHYTFDDQTEMVEEYDAKTNALLGMINPVNSIEFIICLSAQFVNGDKNRRVV